MKTVWNAVIVVALANLLALTAFVGWLVGSDRLNMDRVRQIRMVLSISITEQKVKEASAEAKAQAESKAQEEAAKAAKAPLTAAEKLAARVEATDLDRERAARLRREVESLQQRLAADADKLAMERRQFDAERKAYTESVAAELAKSEDQQFQKSLGVLASLKPAAAKSMLMQLISGDAQGGGAPQPAAGNAAMNEAQAGQAVAYLNAMDERPRSKIMSEFAKDDPKLAAYLLEKLRTRGQMAKAVPAAPGVLAK